MRQHPTLVLCDVQPLAKKAAGMDSLEDVNNYTNVFTNYVGTEDNWKASHFIETFLLARSLVDGKFVPLDTSDFKYNFYTKRILEPRLPGRKKKLIIPPSSIIVVIDHWWCPSFALASASPRTLAPRSKATRAWLTE